VGLAFARRPSPRDTGGRHEQQRLDAGRLLSEALERGIPSLRPTAGVLSLLSSELTRGHPHRGAVWAPRPASWRGKGLQTMDMARMAMPRWHGLPARARPAS
jgi:hypothetical protein